MKDIVYNKLLFCVTGGGVTVYMKEATEYRGWYAVKVMHKGGAKEFVYTGSTLSGALRKMAETVAQFTDGFTTWNYYSA